MTTIEVKLKGNHLDLVKFIENHVSFYTSKAYDIAFNSKVVTLSFVWETNNREAALSDTMDLVDVTALESCNVEVLDIK